MLRWRLALGTLFVLIVLGLCYADLNHTAPSIALLPLAALLAWFTADEAAGLLEAGGLPLRRWLVVGGSTAVVLSNWVGHIWPDVLGGLGIWGPTALTLSAAVLIALIIEVLRFESTDQVVARVAGTLAGLVYAGWLFSFIVQLRWTSVEPWGMAALASLLLVVKSGDIGAYAVGRLIGRHKLAPKLSPGKTIEGALGGLAFSVAVAWLTLQWAAPAWIGNTVTDYSSTSWGWLAYGLVVGAVGMIGDLAESLLKRAAGKKDSSNWMPGFGGVLDLLDSLLLAAPVAYLFWALGWVGPR